MDKRKKLVYLKPDSKEMKVELSILAGSLNGNEEKNGDPEQLENGSVDNDFDKRSSYYLP